MHNNQTQNLNENNKKKQHKQRKLPLPETSNEAFDKKNFLRLKANAKAFDALLEWQAHSAINSQKSKQTQTFAPQIFALSGPAKCGKSYLGEIWRAQQGAVPITPQILQSTQNDVLKKMALKPMWLDCAHNDNLDNASVELEKKLYALYNSITQNPEKNLALLITSRIPPAKWKLKLPDLKSRMRAIVSHSINELDDNDSLKLLQQIFRARQLNVDQRVYTYLVRRIERSFQTHHEIAKKIDALSLIHKRKITLQFLLQHLHIKNDAEKLT